MTTFLVTAASGHLGRLAVDALLARGVAPETVRAGARDTAKLADLDDLGVIPVRADYDDPASLAQAMATDGGEELRFLFISGSEVGRRQPQHQAVVDAAS